MKNKVYLIFIAVALLSICACVNRNNEVRITDAKTTASIDENLMPVKPTSIFQQGTYEVLCWFKWENAEKDNEITASWYFIPDDIHILDSSFKLPRKIGSGSVSLTMPKDKELPPGTYRINLRNGKKILRTINFTITQDKAIQTQEIVTTPAATNDSTSGINEPETPEQDLQQTGQN